MKKALLRLFGKMNVKLFVCVAVPKKGRIRAAAFVSELHADAWLKRHDEDVKINATSSVTLNAKLGDIIRGV